MRSLKIYYNAIMQGPNKEKSYDTEMHLNNKKEDIQLALQKIIKLSEHGYPKNNFNNINITNNKKNNPNINHVNGSNLNSNYNSKLGMVCFKDNLKTIDKNTNTNSCNKNNYVNNLYCKFN